MSGKIPTASVSVLSHVALDHSVRIPACLAVMNLGPLSLLLLVISAPPQVCVCVYAGDVSRRSPRRGSASPTQQWPCVAWRLRCVCHVRPILTVSPPSITAYPLSIHPGDRALSPACMAWSFLPLHRRVKSWVQIEKCPSDFRFRCYSSCEK